VNKRPWLSGKEDSSNIKYTHTHTDDDPAESRHSVEVFDSGKIRWAKTTLFLPPLSSFPPKFDFKKVKTVQFQRRKRRKFRLRRAHAICDWAAAKLLRNRRSHIQALPQHHNLPAQHHTQTHAKYDAPKFVHK
jgi:hypothetical protein